MVVVTFVVAISISYIPITAFIFLPVCRERRRKKLVWGNIM